MIFKRLSLKKIKQVLFRKVRAQLKNIFLRIVETDLSERQS